LEQETGMFLGLKIIKDLEKFKNISDMIVTNRTTKELDDAIEKIYTRDLFHVC